MIASNEKKLAAEREGKFRLRRLLWWGRALITAGLAWYLISQVRGELDHLRLQLVHPWYLFLALAAAIIAVLTSVWVWRMMLPSSNRPAYFTLVAHYLLGFFYNNFLPGGLGGDVVRAGALVQGGQRIGQAANSVLMARLAGLWSIVLLACLSVLFYTLQAGWQAASLLIFGTLGGLVVASLGSAVLFGAPMAAVMKALPGRLHTWHNELQAYRGQPKLLMQALLLSFGIQILAVVVNACMARALGLPISFEMLLLAIPLVNLVVLLPISIGGFGVREGAYTFLLASFGVGVGQAVLLSLAVYVLLVLVAALGAAVSQFWVPENGGADQCAS